MPSVIIDAPISYVCVVCSRMADGLVVADMLLVSCDILKHKHVVMIHYGLCRIKEGTSSQCF